MSKFYQVELIPEQLGPFGVKLTDFKFVGPLGTIGDTTIGTPDVQYDGLRVNYARFIDEPQNRGALYCLYDEQSVTSLGNFGYTAGEGGREIISRHYMTSDVISVSDDVQVPSEVSGLKFTQIPTKKVCGTYTVKEVNNFVTDRKMSIYIPNGTAHILQSDRWVPFNYLSLNTAYGSTSEGTQSKYVTIKNSDENISYALYND